MRCPYCDGTGKRKRRESVAGFGFVSEMYGGPTREVIVDCEKCSARGYILHGAQLQAAREKLWEAVGCFVEALRWVDRGDFGLAALETDAVPHWADAALRIIGEEP